MGMSKTKADIDFQIADYQRQIEFHKGVMANAKLYKHGGWQNQVAHCQSEIAMLKTKIARARAERKSAK